MEAGRPQTVAVKDMKGDRNVRVHELLKESRIMASLSHPNVCQFIGICADLKRAGGKQYILSELMDCSLFDLIHQPDQVRWSGELTIAVSLWLCEKISAGIGYLHSMKLVHADLKSSNVLVDHTSSPTLTAKICDFGHVAVRAHPAPHRQCGTPHWAAPEALRNEAVSPAADMFSVGTILWEMVMRRVPHAELSFAQVLGVVGWGAWLPGSDEELQAEAPPAVVDIVRVCTKFVSTLRPTADEVRRRVRKILRRVEKDSWGLFAGFYGGSI